MNVVSHECSIVCHECHVVFHECRVIESHVVCHECRVMGDYFKSVKQFDNCTHVITKQLEGFIIIKTEILKIALKNEK